MGKDIKIRNTVYENVPMILVPEAEGPAWAEFVDTSDATLNSSAKMAKNVTAYSHGAKWIGSAEERDSSDLSASGDTVTVPAGFYASAASKAVASGSATAPATISGTSATVSSGTNTLTLSKTISVTPDVTAGYVSSGTAGNSAVSLTASVTTKGAATITPTTSAQTIASGTYLTGTQTISGDANLVSSNIVSGKSIFSVQGSAVVPVISQDQYGILSIS